MSVPDDEATPPTSLNSMLVPLFGITRFWNTTPRSQIFYIFQNVRIYKMYYFVFIIRQKEICNAIKGAKCISSVQG